MLTLIATTVGVAGWFGFITICVIGVGTLDR